MPGPDSLLASPWQWESSIAPVLTSRLYGKEQIPSQPSRWRSRAGLS